MCRWCPLMRTLTLAHAFCGVVPFLQLVKSSEGGKLRVPRADAYAEVEATKDAAVLLASQLSAAAARLAGGDTEEDARNAPATGEQAAAVLRNMKGEGLSQVTALAARTAPGAARKWHRADAVWLPLSRFL